MNQDVHARFLSKIEKQEEGCWIWIGARDGCGYGKFYMDGRYIGAHRVSYELTLRLIPKGKEIDHLCRNRACVNPDHLEPVSHRENVKRSTAGQATARRERAKTHCPHGHEYNEANTYRTKKAGHRHCRTCQRARSAARRLVRG